MNSIRAIDNNITIVEAAVFFNFGMKNWTQNDIPKISIITENVISFRVTLPDVLNPKLLQTISYGSGALFISTEYACSPKVRVKLEAVKQPQLSIAQNWALNPGLRLYRTISLILLVYRVRKAVAVCAWWRLSKECLIFYSSCLCCYSNNPLDWAYWEYISFLTEKGVMKASLYFNYSTISIILYLMIFSSSFWIWYCSHFIFYYN